MINETCAKNEALERELGTQKEILRQFDQSKRELVGKLMADLWSVESRWLQVLDRNNMVGEDYRMRAHHNFEKLIKEKAYSRECELKINKLQITLDDVGSIIPKQEAEIEYLSM